MGRVIRTFEYQSLDLQRSVRWISWRLEERRVPYTSDGKVGREKYRSVHGFVQPLERLADVQGAPSALALAYEVGKSAFATRTYQAIAQQVSEHVWLQKCHPGAFESQEL